MPLHPVEHIAAVNDVLVGDDAADDSRVHLAGTRPHSVRCSTTSGAAGGLEGRGGVGDLRVHALGVRHRLGVIEDDSGTLALAGGRHVEGGRVADVVAVGLERRTQDADLGPGERAVEEFAGQVDRAGPGGAG